MIVASLNDLVQVLRQAELLSPGQWSELGSLGRFRDPRELAKELLRRGWLTPYQANQFLQGNGADLVLSNYLLLERLGEGGMGTVYKARHKNGSVVALKVIRKERGGNTTFIRRFSREIQASSRLNHPNIVRTLEAQQSGDVHFMVMEYAEGTDLAKQVKEHGPLPVPQACDCIRQAALGLQHVLENGLVHRDIKPSNLLITRAGVVKLLDLGLARMETDAGESLSTLTQEGSVLGTPEFLAPEQARSATKVDIRADLYSLGCTFYFVLTGKVPFPGGTLAEKLIRHQIDHPRPVQELQPRVSPEVAAMVARLMAKEPAERYQTPGQLADELGRLLKNGKTELAQGQAHKPNAWLASEDWVDKTAAAATKPAKSRRVKRIAVMAGGGFALVAAGLGLFLLLHQPGSGKWNGPATPMDDLKASNIPAESQFPGMPPEIVGILNGKQVGLRGPIPSIAVSPDGKHVASTSGNGDVYCWDIGQPNKPRVLKGHTDSTTAVAFSPDGQSLASGASNRDRTVKLWDLKAGTPSYTSIPQAGAVGPIAFAPDGKILLWGTSGPNPQSVDVNRLDLARMTLISPLRRSGPLCPAWAAFAISPGGKTAALANHYSKIDVYTIRKGIPGPSKEITPIWKAVNKGGASINILAFTGDSKVLASAGQDGLVRFWDTATLQESTKPIAVNRPVLAMALSPDGTKVVTVDATGQLIWWDPATQLIVKSWGNLPGTFPAIAFAPDSRHLVAGFCTKELAGSVLIFRLEKEPK